MTYSRDEMYNFKPVDGKVELSGGKMRIAGRGSLHLSIDSSAGDHVEVELQEAAFVPTFDKHLSFLPSVACHGYLTCHAHCHVAL